ncbi:MAG: quinone oxidoreductase family protein [Acidimicrobiales bacterium]
MMSRSARLTHHGEALSIEEIELPDPGPGQLLVEMSYAGVNPVDRYQVLGRVAADAVLPRTAGSEGAGLVLPANGSAQRSVFVNRDAVVRPEDGLWATHVLVNADKVIDLPQAMDLKLAAAMGVAGVTAWRCVTELGMVTRKDRVLVLGASGGVGSIIVSIAHRLGSEVVAQSGSEAKVGFVEALGADRVVVAGAGRLIEALGGWKPTVVFDPLGGGFTGASIEALDPRGRLVLFGTSAEATGTVPLQALYRKGLKIFGYSGLIEPAEAIARGICDGLEALNDGRMEIVVGSVLPLSDVNVALDRLANRQVEGKQVLDLQR